MTQSVYKNGLTWLSIASAPALLRLSLHALAVPCQGCWRLSLVVTVCCYCLLLLSPVVTVSVGDCLWLLLSVVTVSGCYCLLLLSPVVTVSVGDCLWLLLSVVTVSGCY